MTQPTVTIAVPVLNEESHLGACLNSIASQTYPHIAEVLVVDGGSTDRTRTVAARPAVTVLDNPRRIQAAALNVALDAAKGEVFVRVDGHCVIDPDYVERCVEALDRTGAAMVGGGMTPVAEGWKERGIAAAMSSPFGAGPARFHVGGEPGWVDTVYLGAFATDTARRVGGYAEDVGVNEDAELAIRMADHGGVWFDPAIRSNYSPRSGFLALGRQFFRYGQSRASTVKRHPRSLALRQLAAPALCLALLSRWRRPIGITYAGGVLCLARRASSEHRGRIAFGLALPTMHLSWGAGSLWGALGLLASGSVSRRRTGRTH